VRATTDDLEVSRVALSISAVLLLLFIVFLLVRKSGLKGGHAIVCVLLGFYLASTSVAPSISQLTSNMASVIGSFKM
jgi:hypothetical protein